MNMELLEIKDLHKSYGNREILKGINLSIEKGTVTCIIGTSGSGKSTLLRTINLLEEPTNGNIYFNEKNILSIKDICGYRSKVNMVFQNYNLFKNMNVLENCMIGPMRVLGINKNKAKKEALSKLKRVGLSHRILARPRELSGGEKQRVAIARCLCMNPEIILFDEPTSALDPLMVSEVLNVIKDLKDSGITLIIVTHEMHFAKEIADKVVFMHNGIVFESGSSDRIFNRPKSEELIKFLKNFKEK